MIFSIDNRGDFNFQLHIVTYNMKYANLSTALPNSDGLAVLCFFIQVRQRGLIVSVGSPYLKTPYYCIYVHQGVEGWRNIKNVFFLNLKITQWSFQ